MRQLVMNDVQKYNNRNKGIPLRMVLGESQSHYLQTHRPNTEGEGKEAF